jgi:predicted ester cyclase
MDKLARMANELADLAWKFFQEQDRLRGGPDPELCTADYRMNLAGLPAMDMAAHQGFAAAFYAAFPDLVHVKQDAIGEGDSAAVRFRMEGTHTGDFMGIPPTGRKVVINAIAMFHFQDGKINQVFGQFDQLGLMQQLGVVPS